MYSTAVSTTTSLFDSVMQTIQWRSCEQIQTISEVIHRSYSKRLQMEGCTCCSVWTSSVLNVIFRTYQFNQRSTHLFNGTGSLSACMWVEEEGWRAHLKKDEWVEGQMPLCCQCECVCLCGKHLNFQLLLFGRLRAVILLKCSATHSRCNLLTMSAEQHDTRGPRPAETTS